MIFYIIPTIIIIASLGVIFFIILKKLPGIASINVESIAQENQSKVRNKIMVARLNRKLVKLKNFIISLLRPLKGNIQELSKTLHQKAVEMERESMKKSQPLKKIDLGHEIGDKVEAIKKYMADQNFEAAEEECISVIGMNKDSLDAYELLSEIYIENKDYKKARETSRYLLKLLTRKKEAGDVHRLANCYADLGLIYQLEDKNSLASANFKKAAELEPNNPRFLDLFLKISIILKDKDLAVEAFNNLEKSDPDNQKLAEIREEIDSL